MNVPALLRQLAESSVTEGSVRIDGRLVTVIRILTTPEGIAALRKAADQLEENQ